MSEQKIKNPVGHPGPRYDLWKHMADEHNLTLLDSELHEIERLAAHVVSEELKERCDKAESACSEMRKHLLDIHGGYMALDHGEPIDYLFEAIKASSFSSDCGKATLEKVERLRATLLKLWNDCCASDFNEHWDSYVIAEKTLEETK